MDNCTIESKPSVITLTEFNVKKKKKKAES